MRGAFRPTISQSKMWTWDIMDHPPYSPDLAPSHFHLFLHLKKHLAGKKFDEDDVREEVTTWFKRLAADFCDSGIQKPVPRLNKCLDNAGDHVEKYSYIDAIHSQCRFCKLKMLYIFKTFVSLLSGHAKMRDYEKPQPSNMAYLAGGRGVKSLQHQKDKREKPGNLLTKKWFFFPTPLSPWKKFPSLKQDIPLNYTYKYGCTSQETLCVSVESINAL